MNGKDYPIQAYSKEKFEDLLRQYSIKLDNDYIYDALYAANMCKADYYGRSIKTEADLVQFVKDTVDDPDGYDGMVFTRFYADCIGSGTPIDWEAML